MLCKLLKYGVSRACCEPDSILLQPGLIHQSHFELDPVRVDGLRRGIQPVDFAELAQWLNRVYQLDRIGNILAAVAVSRPLDRQAPNSINPVGIFRYYNVTVVVRMVLKDERANCDSRALISFGCIINLA